MIEQDAKSEQEGIDGKKGKAVEAHILLSRRKIATGEIFLHHILIQPRHHNNDKDSADELPPKGLCAACVPFKNATHRAVGDDAPRFGRRNPEGMERGSGDTDQRKKEHEGLEHIGVEQSGLSRTLGVCPYQQKTDGSGEREGNAERSRHKGVQHEGGQIKTCRCAREFAQKKKEGTGAVGGESESLPEIGIDAGEIQTIVERKKEKGHGHIAQNVTHTHLQIGHTDAGHPSRHTDERNA